MREVNLGPIKVKKDKTEFTEVEYYILDKIFDVKTIALITDTSVQNVYARIKTAEKSQIDLTLQPSEMKKNLKYIITEEKAILDGMDKKTKMTFMDSLKKAEALYKTVESVPNSPAVRISLAKHWDDHGRLQMEAAKLWLKLIPMREFARRLIDILREFDSKKAEEFIEKLEKDDITKRLL